MLSACETELASLLREVQQALAVPIGGVISDGQHSIRNAVQAVLPDIAHQLCHFHYLREAAKPVYEADRHAKKGLKKHLRGVRPIERAVEKRNDEEAEAIRGYCLAVRSALTDDGRPPLEAPGLKLNARISAIGPVGVILTEKYDVPYNSCSILCLRSQLESSCSQNGSIGSSAVLAPGLPR